MTKKQERPKPQGSGVIPLPCRERPFIPLSGKDPKLEHWKLCMETRKR